MLFTWATISIYKVSVFLLSLAKIEHWERKNLPKRDQMVISQDNTIKETLVEKSKIIFPPLHIKLGLMKQFVK